MWLPDVSIRRPVFAVMLVGAFVALGALSLGRIGVDLFPRVEFPYVVVTTVLEGATPETIESEVTDVLEEHINTISGIEDLRSTSAEGYSRILVRFALEEDVDVKAQDVRDKVALARLDLPPDIDPPVVEKVDPDSSPILAVMVSGPFSQRELTRLAKDVVKTRLERLPGVGSVTLVGGREREVRVWADVARLRGYGLAVDDLARALQTEHADVPGGRFEAEGGRVELSFKTKGEVQRVEEFGDLVVAFRGDAPIRVRDVARVEDGLEDDRSYAELDGTPGVSLLVRRQSGRNTVAVARAVRAEAERLEAELPAGTRLLVVQDVARFIEASIHDVAMDMVLGGILAVLITLAFLRSVRSTLIVGIAIPASVIATFFFFYVLDFTLNVLTLMALSVSIGLLIDDAIVVLENIYRHIEAGVPPLEAARKGTAEIGGAVLASTFSIWAVFLPIAFMTGVIGRFFYQYGLAVVFAVGMSLLVAFTVTPTLSGRALRREVHHGRLFELSERFYAALEAHYRRVLAAALRHRWAVLAAAVAAVVAGGLLAQRVPLSFSPKADRSEFEAYVELPLGTGIAAAREAAARVASGLRELEHVKTVFARIGGSGDTQVNEIHYYVGLTPKQERRTGQLEIMDRARAVMLERAPEAKSIAVTEVPWVGGSGFRAYDVEYAVMGEDLRELDRITREISARLAADPRFADVKTDFELGRPELRAWVDRGRAAELGVPVKQLATTLRALVGGVDVATFEDGGKRYDVRLRLPEAQRDELADLSAIPVRAVDGRLTDLANLARLEVAYGPSEISREDRTRSITVLASARPGVALGTAAEAVDRAAAEIGLPAGYRAVHHGPIERMQESVDAIRLAFVLALVALYMILASQFNSFAQPAIIMLAAPLSFVGAFAGLVITGIELSIFAQIALVVLMGLVMKNGILLVDLANQRRLAGASAREAMLFAGPVRLRPVMMTTFSTVFGMIPIAIARSDGAEFRNPMGVLVIGGLLSSMFLTLVVVPVAYTLLDDARTRVLAWAAAARGAARRARTQRPEPARPAPGGVGAAEPRPSLR